MEDKAKIEQDEATAFLTGIVAATDRFSNGKTSPEVMKIASRLMESGANQQLISKNISANIGNELLGSPATDESPAPAENPPSPPAEDDSNLNISHR